MECLFCKIANAEIPANIIYTDESIMAFEDIDPKAPHHLLIIPRQHIISLADADLQHIELLGQLLWVAKQLAVDHGFAKQGYRVVINSREWGGQTVNHLHVHVLGGKRMNWPPG